MRKDVAVAKLQALKTEALNDEICNMQLKSYVRSFLGVESVEYAQISDRLFTMYPVNMLGINEKEITIELTDKHNKYIDACCEKIRIEGVYKPERPNFLYRISDKWLAAIAGLLLVLFPTIYNIGKQDGQNDIKDDKIKSLQEQLDKKLVSPQRVSPLPDAKPITPVKDNRQK